MKKYVEAEIEVLPFSDTDVIVTSHGEGEEPLKVGDESNHF